MLRVRLGVVVAIVALDLVTKWAMFDSNLLNRRLPADEWALLALLPVYAGMFAALSTGLLFTTGAKGIAFALILGGCAGQAAQFLATGYVSDWIPVAGYWTNVADIAILIGAALLLIELGRYVASEMAPREGIRQH